MKVDRPVDSRRDHIVAHPVLDPVRFIDAVVRIPEATHFAAAGGRRLHRWFHPVARTREPARIEGFDHLVACRLDLIARESVRRLLRKAWRINGGGSLWHWWLYDDERVLVAIYDWNCLPALIDDGLADWAKMLVDDGVLASAVPFPPVD